MINEEVLAVSGEKASMLPLVSIVIPAYNHERYVEQSLLSAINQTYSEIELIIIDDGSTDGTAAVIEKMLRGYSHNRHVTFVRQSNQGLSKTLNTALGHAKGEFIQFLASDDAYLPEKTSICVNALVTAPKSVAAVYSDGYLINDKNAKIMRFSDKYLRPLSSNTHKELLLGNWIPALGVLYRKSAIERIGGFDESLAVEDYDFLLRLTKIFDFKSVPEKLFLYRWHHTNFSKNQERMAEQFRLIREKHPDLRSFYAFVTALREVSLLSVIKNISPENIELLARSFIRKVQIKYSIQGVGYIELFSILAKKSIFLGKARVNAIIASVRGIKIGKGAKVYGRIRTIGNNKNIRIGDRVVIRGDLTIISPYSYTKNQIYIGDDVVLEHNSVIFSLGGDIRVENGCFIGPNVIIQANGNVSIGSFTMIASNSSVYANNHNADLNGIPFKKQGNRFVGVTIGDNCWIGTGVSILDGASIGNNTVVGANCVVKGVHDGDAVVIAKSVIGYPVLIQRQTND